MNVKIMEAMEYMDEKYIGEVLEARKKASTRKTLMRWGSIAACFVLILGLCVGFMGGVPGGAGEEIVRPPVRVGKSVASASLEKGYSFTEAYQEADAVALIRIGNWVEEREMVTVYQADVIACYKGGIEGTINFIQTGTSKTTLKYYPLYTYGNEVLVFMFKGSPTYGTDTYYSIGAYTTDMIVVRDANGKAYVPSGFFVDLMLENANLKLNVNTAQANTLYQRYIEADPEMASMTASFTGAYDLDELVSMFTSPK